MRNEIVWIKPCPRLLSFDRFVNLSGDVSVILLNYVQTFALTDAIAKIVSLLHVLFRRVELVLVAVVNTDARVSHREVRIELDGALVESQRLARSAFRAFVVTHRKRFQCFQRRSRSLLDTHIVLLNRAQRLAEFLAQIRRRSP